MTPLLVALLLSSNASGKTLVRTNPGTVMPISGVSGPLIADDANTVAHVTWNGATLADSKGNAWAMQGTVPQVAKSGKTPAGSGPYSSSNYYLLTGPLAGATMTICIVFSGQGAGVSIRTGAAPFYWMQVTGTISRFGSSSGGGSDTATTAQASGLNVACGGISGTTTYGKMNLGALVSNGSATSAQSAGNAAIGVYAAQGSPFPNTIHEIWVTTTTPSDALFTAVMQRAKSRGGVTAW